MNHSSNSPSMERVLVSQLRGFRFPSGRGVVAVLRQEGLALGFQGAGNEGLIVSEMMRVFLQKVTGVGLLSRILEGLASAESAGGEAGTGRELPPGVGAPVAELGRRAVKVGRTPRLVHLGGIKGLFEPWGGGHGATQTGRSVLSPVYRRTTL